MDIIYNMSLLANKFSNSLETLQSDPRIKKAVTGALKRAISIPIAITIVLMLYGVFLSRWYYDAQTADKKDKIVFINKIWFEGRPLAGMVFDLWKLCSILFAVWYIWKKFLGMDLGQMIGDNFDRLTSLRV